MCRDNPSAEEADTGSGFAGRALLPIGEVWGSSRDSFFSALYKAVVDNPFPLIVLQL